MVSGWDHFLDAIATSAGCPAGVAIAAVAVGATVVNGEYPVVVVVGGNVVVSASTTAILAAAAVAVTASTATAAFAWTLHSLGVLNPSEHSEGTVGL